MTKISKFSLLLLSILNFPILGISQQTITYTGNFGNAGFNLEKQSSTGVQLSFSVTKITLDDLVLNGETMKTVEIPGVFLPNNEGAPNLPGTGRYVAIPQEAVANLEIMELRTEVIHNVEIAPAPRIPKETEVGLDYHKDLAIYNKDALYPAQPVILSAPTKIRGVDVVMLGFTPFQYNPVTKDLIIYKDIRVKINYTGGNNHVGEDRLRSRWFDPLLQDMLLNPSVLPEVNYNKTTVNTDDVGFEYLIIVPDEPFFKQWADSIKLFRQRQGIITGIKTLSEVGGNNYATIENYLNNAYNNWSVPPVACLLIGDYGSDINNTIDAPIWNAYCVSDNIYGDVDGNNLPDIIMARMTAQDENQLRVMVRKFIDYERTPPTDPGFYDHPITALGWQTERWFQLCSEVVRGFWQNGLGKSPVRINSVFSGNPASDPWSTATNTNTVVDYFGPSGLNYITATPQGIGGFSGGTPAQVNDAINEGSFMLQHRDHGFENGWGEPAYTSIDINGLHNTNLCFIMSVNCLTGKYNYSSEVFAEKFHRYTWNDQPSGALGILAASEISYSFVNDAFIWGVYDNMWPNFMPAYGSNPPERGILPAFGNAAGKYFLEQSSWPYNTDNKEVTYNLFHHHGDAFLTVYSEVPQSLTVSHDPVIFPGITSVNVTATAGALICLSLNGEILGTGIGTGSPVTIAISGNQLPPDIIDVVATLQNYYRYEGQILVIPPSGPYIVKDKVVVNDISGNNNGQADFGENITLHIGMKNVGIAQGNNITVTLQTSDPEVTVLDNVENYGTIPSDSTITMNDAFNIVIDSTIIDGHTALFDLIATDGTDTWNSHFSLVLNAPLLKATAISVSDVTGNNNSRLDPGETVTLRILTNNLGHTDAVNTIGTLTTANPSVTITQASYNLGTINGSASQVAEFTVEVSPTAVLGENILFNYTVASGDYQSTKYFIQSIGLVYEDWECNGFTHYNWSNPNPSWTITSTSPYEGLRCARSASIGDNTSTTLSISLDVIAYDTISFYRKVSSEATYDFLQFIVDNSIIDQWSGSVDWGRVAYPVTPGIHTFSWKYVKDQFATGGSDAAWIDFIMFPPYGGLPLEAAASATPSTLCFGDSAQLNVIAMGGIQPYTYQWSPTTGLSDPTIANPVAAPAVTTLYTVSITDLNNEVQIESITVTVIQIPGVAVVPTTPQTQICQGITSTLVSTSMVQGATFYTWSLTPAASGYVNGSDTSAWLNWNTNYTGPASVTVQTSNSCGSSDPSVPLEIMLHPKPLVTLSPLANICINYPPITLTGGTPPGGTYSGIGVNLGIFDPAVAGTGTWGITYTYTDSNNCSDLDTKSIYVDPCAGIEDVSNVKGIQLFPNPTTGMITLRLNEIKSEPLTISIFNGLGKLLQKISNVSTGTEREIKLDLGNQAEGIYFITVQSNSAVFNQKVMVQGR